jgi:hypothetical protein
MEAKILSPFQGCIISDGLPRAGVLGNILTALRGFLSRPVQIRARAISRRTDVDVRLDPGGCLISLGDLRGKPRCVVGLNQVHRTSAEASARHAPATIAVERLRDLDHDVQFTATDFKKIAQTGV